jgi:hypothetical protein
MLPGFCQERSASQFFAPWAGSKTRERACRSISAYQSKSVSPVSFRAEAPTWATCPIHNRHPACKKACEPYTSTISTCDQKAGASPIPSPAVTRMRNDAGRPSTPAPRKVLGARQAGLNTVNARFFPIQVAQGQSLEEFAGQQVGRKSGGVLYPARQHGAQQATSIHPRYWQRYCCRVAVNRISGSG